MGLGWKFGRRTVGYVGFRWGLCGFGNGELGLVEVGRGGLGRGYEKESECYGCGDGRGTTYNQDASSSCNEDAPSNAPTSIKFCCL